MGFVWLGCFVWVGLKCIHEDRLESRVTEVLHFSTETLSWSPKRASVAGKHNNMETIMMELSVFMAWEFWELIKA